MPGTRLIASHIRLFKRGAHAILDAHRPANHRTIIDTTIERLLQPAEAIAPSVAQVLRDQVNRKRHPEEALRVDRGILRLAQDLSPAQLAAACELALILKAFNDRAYVRSSSRRRPNLAMLASYRSCTKPCAGPSTYPLITEILMLIEPMIQQLHQLRLHGMAGDLEQLLRNAQLQALRFRGATERDDPARGH